MNTKQVHADYAKTVADKVIKMLEEGTAPWTQPWKPGFGPTGREAMPFNAASGRAYSGGNALHLWAVAQERGYEDNRWMTFKQVQDRGLRLKEGSKGHGAKVEFWDFSKVRQDKTDEGESGKTDEQRRRGPSVFLFTVFNGSMVEGMPEQAKRQVPDITWRHGECERLLAESGASINHDGGDRAFYRPLSDTIHLPVKEAFESATGFFATALHELGHWSGHETRLNRDQSGVFGTESYAKEELVAELSSMMMGDRLGIGHDPGQHVAYIGSWIKLLKKDPMAIMRAASQAEAVCKHLGIEAYQNEPIQVQERKQEHQADGQEAKPQRRRRSQRKTQTAASEAWSPGDMAGEQLAPEGQDRGQRRERQRGMSMSM